jgi:ATP phosphoribosyltransferase
MKKCAKKYRIAIQKTGRLNADSLEILNSICQKNKITDYEPILVRDDDIPYLIQNGACDLGIVGENVLNESGLKIPILETLAFGHCRLSFAVPDQFNYRSVRDLNGCRIATSYPKILRKFAIKNQLNITIVILNGSVEIAPRLGIADVVCDLVATGKTLIEHQLKEVETLMQSQAVLIGGF